MALRNDVHAGWSNPCFEIWMYAYFGEMPAIKESYKCCDKFADKYEKITGQKYTKSDKEIYSKLVRYGDAAKAVEIAERCLKECMDDGKRKPSEMRPACMVHQLVEEIESKVKIS